MTFKQFAERIGIDIEDLFYSDMEAVEQYGDEELFDCLLLDDYIADGVLSRDLQTVTDL